MSEATKRVHPPPPSRPSGEHGDWLARWQAWRINAGTWFLGILAALAIAWTLRQSVSVTAPVAFGFFIALCTFPICSWVQQRVSRRLRWLGYVAAMVALLAFLAAFFGGILLAAQYVASEFPQRADNLPQIWEQVLAWAREQGLPVPPEIGQFGTETQQSSQPQGAGGRSGSGAQQSRNIVNAISGYAFDILNSVGRALAMMVLIFFVVLLALIEAPIWRDKIASTAGRNDEAWVRTVITIAQQVRRYLLVRTALGVLSGLAYGLWLLVFGIDYVFVWGMLAFLLNYIPTFGSLVAGALPVLLAFTQKDAGTAIGIGVGILVIEQIIGNYIDPRLQGRQLSISPLVVLFALLVWGWIWGVAGALLAVPMTVLIMVTFAHIPALRPLALFLSNERDMTGLDRRTNPE